MSDHDQTTKRGSSKRTMYDIDWRELGFKVAVAMAMGLGSALAGHAVNYAVGSHPSRKNVDDGNIVPIRDRKVV